MAPAAPPPAPFRMRTIESKSEREKTFAYRVYWTLAPRAFRMHIDDGDIEEDKYRRLEKLGELTVGEWAPTAYALLLPMRPFGDVIAACFAAKCGRNVHAQETHTQARIDQAVIDFGSAEVAFVPSNAPTPDVSPRVEKKNPYILGSISSYHHYTLHPNLSSNQSNS